MYTYRKEGEKWFMKSVFLEDAQEVGEADVPKKERAAEEKRLARLAKRGGAAGGAPSSSNAGGGGAGGGGPSPTTRFDASRPSKTAKIVTDSSADAATRAQYPQSSKATATRTAFTKQQTAFRNQPHNVPFKKSAKRGPLHNYSKLQQQQQRPQAQVRPNVYAENDDETDCSAEEFIDDGGEEKEGSQPPPAKELEEGLDYSFKIPERELPPLTAESRKRIEKLRRRMKCRYQIFDAAIEEISRLEAKDASKKVEPKAWDAPINAEIVERNLTAVAGQFHFDFEYFAMKDLAEFSEKKNVVVTNFFDFFMQNEDRSPYFDENGNCYYCAAHGIETAAVASSNAGDTNAPAAAASVVDKAALRAAHVCPQLECNCVECHILDMLKLEDE